MKNYHLWILFSLFLFCPTYLMISQIWICLFFLIDPRNAWQDCVCCPYGCRAIRRRQVSNKRVKAYYRTDAGRQKKRALNRLRSLRAAAPAEPEAESPSADEQNVSSEIITHVQVVMSLFEGRPVRRDEVVELFAQILRQRSMGGRHRGGYGAPQMTRNSRGG